MINIEDFQNMNMEVKRSGNVINIYNGKKLILHLSERNGIYTAVDNFSKISARIESDGNFTRFSDISLKKMNSSGKMVKNTSKKWIGKYSEWLETICKQFGLLD